MNKNIAPTIKPDNRPISVIIPAAGFGSRMKSYGAKSLTKIKNDITIIDNQLKNIYKNIDNCEIILVGGFEFNRVKRDLNGKSRLTIVENSDWENSNVVKSIKIGLDKATHDNVLIIYGDLVFNIFTLKVPIGPYSMILEDPNNLMKKEEVGLISNDEGMLLNMMYSLPKKWAQIVYLNNKELKLFKEHIKHDSVDHYHGFEIINKVLSDGGKFAVRSNPKSKITDIDSSKDLKKVKDII